MTNKDKSIEKKEPSKSFTDEAKEKGFINKNRILSINRQD